MISKDVAHRMISASVFGTPPEEVGKLREFVEHHAQYKEIAEALWGLLDDIDTLDDACRDRNDLFREHVRVRLKKRFEHLTSDGYRLYLPGQEPREPAVQEPAV